MNDTPSELKYSESHEWVRVEDDGNFRIGITAHAQQLLGDMVYVELPEVDSTVKAGDECAVVESVKAASDVYSPVSGEVVAINEALVDDPSLINTDPYLDGWLFMIAPESEIELDELMDSEEYSEKITE